ncbi:MAG: ROK family protein [Verrucomicrobia bacterium]|jgi:glucokinase|nr:ROK family protein [Verrucomicrobiota bacterium]
MNQSLIGIEIGGTKLQVVLGDSDGQILDRRRFYVDRDLGAHGIRDQIESALTEFLKEGNKTVAVGVGFGGPVDRATGEIACSHQISGWSGFPLAAWLKERTRLPVTVDNDANVAALGEAVLGAGKGSNPVFYVTLGSGVGGGAVVDGSIHHGAQPGESEIGHLRLDRSGSIVEQECSGWAVDLKIRNAIKKEPGSLLAQCVGDRTSNEAKFLGKALDSQCPLAQSILGETAQSLAFALSHVTHLFHPETIIIGGGLSMLGEKLITSVASEFQKYLMEIFLPGPNIKLAQLQEDTVPIGALLMANQSLSNL